MSDIEPGTLLTFPLHDSVCALAHVVHVEDLPLGRYYHMAVLDAVLEAGPEGYGPLGEYLPRTHELDGEDAAPQAIDHFALNEDGLLASQPMIVGWRDVERKDTLGYRTWATLIHEDAARRGLVSTKHRGADDQNDQIENEGAEEGSDVEAEENLPEMDGEGNVDEVDEVNETLVTVRPWHRAIFTESFASVLFSLVEEFRSDDQLRSTRLGSYVTGLYSEDRREEIEALVERLASGDFSASQELAMYGDAAIPVLQDRLPPDPDPQFLEDVLLALTTIGTDRALEMIASIFDAHAGQGTPLAQAAERGYLNAVTMTGGAETLGVESGRLDRIIDPQLADDLRTARGVVAEAGNRNGQG